MEPGSIPWLVALAVLFPLYSILSLARAAMLSRRLRSPSVMLEEKKHGAARLVAATRDTDKLTVTLLLARAVVQTVMTVLEIRFFTFFTHAAAAYNPGMTVFWLPLVVGKFLELVFCELLPRAAARKNPEKAALFAAPFVSLLLLVLWPLAAPLSRVDDGWKKLFGIQKDEAETVTEEELMTLVNAGSDENGINEDERELINNVFAFGDARAKDVMTPRTDIVAVPHDAPAKDALELFKQERFSRMPVYKEDLDHIIGILHFKDLVFSPKNTGFTAESIMRQALFSYESKLTSELFAEMRSMSSPLAVILDEYGGTAGIVTLEDMVEEIVGDIMDEYDEESDITVLVPGEEYTAEGAVKIDDFNEAAGTNLTSEDYDSIGGYVMGLLGDIPAQNEVVEDAAHRIAFTVTSLDKNRIEMLHIRLYKEKEEEVPIDTGE